MIRALALITICMTVACNSPQPPPRTAQIPPALSDTLPASDLALWAYTTADTVRGGGPVRIVVLLRASGEPVAITNFPENYTFLIVGPKGDTLRSDAAPYESGLYGEEPRLSVPRQGFVGQLVDLTCVIPQYGGRGVEDKPCMFRYEFAEPGVYQLVARFRSGIPASSGQNSATLDLRSPPIRVVVR